MAIYFVTGKLGSGKTLCAVGKVRDYLKAGRRVATNLNLELGNLLDDRESKRTAFRLPDKPRLEDLELMGEGCQVQDENQYGLVVLDELGAWFNSREWRDKERLKVINWFLHARKLRWDVIFIVQSIDVIDAQLRETLCEHLVVCRRTDRLGIPIISGFMRWLGWDKIVPKIHVASVYYGQTESKLRVARWVYRGRDLYSSYDTAQRFTDETEILNDDLVDMRASYTVLGPYYTRAIALKEHLKKRLAKLEADDHKDSDAQRPRLYGRRFVFNKNYLYIALLMVPLAWRTASGFIGGQDDQAAAVKPVVVKQKAVVRQKVEIKPLVTQPEPKAVIQDIPGDSVDYVLGILKSGIVRMSVFYSDGVDYHFQLIIKNGERIESITADDLRAQGWAILKRKRYLFLVKGDDRVKVAL